MNKPTNEHKLGQSQYLLIGCVVIRRVCVCLLVCSFVMLLVIFQKIQVKFTRNLAQTLQMSPLTSERSRSTFKVTCFKNDPPVNPVDVINQTAIITPHLIITSSHLGSRYLKGSAGNCLLTVAISSAYLYDHTTGVNVLLTVSLQTAANTHTLTLVHV